MSTAKLCVQSLQFPFSCGKRYDSEVYMADHTQWKLRKPLVNTVSSQMKHFCPSITGPVMGWRPVQVYRWDTRHTVLWMHAKHLELSLTPR